jgi:TonB-linked SusC/RagA family outer membrane protein
LDGKFSLEVAGESSVLVFSFVGMETQELPVGAETSFNVIMVSSFADLDEVIVVGYGTMRKSDLTGAVAKVGIADLKNRATSDAAVALQGKAAGVQILSNSGAPGKAADIRVRGMSSNSDKNGPLLIVDGLKVDNIQYLDPEMIESIEILKDGASAAIYGAAAGNGVVLITTKSGSKSKDGNVFYNAQWQLSSLAGKLDVLNAEQYIDYGKQQGFLTPEKLTNYGYVPGTDIDWADEVFEPTWNSRHTIGFQGGNDQGSYYAAVNHVKNNGIFAGDKDLYKRTTIQINADYKIKSWLTVGSNNSIENWETQSVSQQSDNGSALLGAITTDPLFGPLAENEDQLTQKQKDAIASGIAVIANEDGKYYRLSPVSGETQSANPFIRRDAIEGSSEGINLRGSTYLNFSPIKGFVFTSRFGYRISQSTAHQYEWPYEANEFVRRTTYRISGDVNSSNFTQFENFVNYDTTIGDKHDITVMAGMSWEQNHFDNMSVNADGADILTNYAPNYHYINYIKPDIKKNTTNNLGDEKNLSYFGRLTYSYDSRYSIQANFRADAFDLSKLPKDTRWGYFPSISAGWTISNESFFKNNISENAVSFLKLRGSWGINGNINVLRDYAWAGVVTVNSDWYQYTPYESTLTYGSFPGTKLANRNLTWEESEQIDLGLDARFLNSRLSLTLDWYKKETVGLLIDVKPVIETGVGSTTMNGGNVDNTGLEIELGWKDNIGDLTYSVNANLATLKNKVTYLNDIIPFVEGPNLQGSAIRTRVEEGYSLWYFHGYKMAGVDPATGIAIYEDVNKDGVFNSNDMTDLGSGLPTYTYGLTINLAYKGFDFTVFGTGVGGNKILPQGYRTDRPYCNNYSWFYENSGTNFPSIPNWNDNYAFSSDATVFSGAYFKIKTIQLGYTLPTSLISKLHVSNLRVFGSLENFFTFTDYIGLDPEAASANTNNMLGVDMGTYPTAKQVIFGFNLSF